MVIHLLDVCGADKGTEFYNQQLKAVNTDPIFAKLGSLKVFDIYQFQVSKFIFKCINKIAPVNFQNWFSINHERYGYCTRSTINIMDGKKINNLFIPTARTSNYGMKLLKVKGPRIWNT